MTDLEPRPGRPVDEELFARVRALLARECGVPPDRITLDTTLAWDIGMAGLDAVEFFETFVEEFGIEPESLRRLNFRSHFGDEGMSLADGCLLMAILAPVLAFTEFMRWPGWATGLTAVVWLIIVGAVAGSAQARDPSAIRVRDLVEAAAAKRWLK